MACTSKEEKEGFMLKSKQSSKEYSVKKREWKGTSNCN